jgi:hypothetical protein
LGDNTNTIKIDIIDLSKVVTTEVKAEIPKYVHVFYQDTGKNHNMRTANKPLKCSKVQILGKKKSKIVPVLN